MGNPNSPARDRQFGRLYQAYFKRVCYFFLKQGLPTAQAEELAQEVFLNIYRGMATFRGDAAYETWLFRIVRNTLKNHYRRDAAQMRDAPEVPISTLEDQDESRDFQSFTGTSPGPEKALLSREKSRLLEAAMAELPPQMRQVLVLRLQDGLKYREIADQLEISIDTVKSHIFQARGRLRGSVGDYFEIDISKETGGRYGAS